MSSFSFRSPVLSKNACVVSDQPLASKIGYDILQKGGNAADAAIAMSVAISFLCPHLCGLGGDCNALFYRASDGSVSSINGSGRSAEKLTMSKVKEAGFSLDSFRTLFDLDSAIGPSHHGIFINVPGYVMGIFNLFQKFGSGKLTMKELLDPTIQIAEQGAPLAPKAALNMQNSFDNVRNSKNIRDIFGSDGPTVGGIIRSPKLAKSLKVLSDEGAKAFYYGEIAENIVNAVQRSGGLLTMDDMRYHFNISQHERPSTPVFKDFHGFRLWEMRPNTIGIVVLRALDLLDGVDLKSLGHNSFEYIHILVKAIRNAYIHCWKFLCDPDCRSDDSYTDLFSGKGHTKVSEKCENLQEPISTETQPRSADTSYVTAVDKDGNACSLIFSVLSHFGSGNIPDNCGFMLHDRGKLFSFNETSCNAFGSRKRSLHTIIPAMVTDKTSGELIATFGVIGKWMQPQGHVQVFLNMVIFGMDPQTALQQPRFLVGDPFLSSGYRDSLDIVNLEEGILPSVAEELKRCGYRVPPIHTGLARNVFGVGHIISKRRLMTKNIDKEHGDIWWAGSDPRSDGMPIGY